MTSQDERTKVDEVEIIEERGQSRPADWPKNFPPLKMTEDDIGVPKSEWEWKMVADVDDLMPTGEGTT